MSESVKRDLLGVRESVLPPGSSGGASSAAATSTGGASVRQRQALSSSAQQQQQQLPKLTGLQREVYQLTGSVAPALAPSRSAAAAQSYRARRTKRVNYVRCEFTNEAHPAGEAFKLTHWVRADRRQQQQQQQQGVASEGEYPFARFDKRVKTPVYTDREYEVYQLARLQPDPPAAPWSKAETDLLFRMCERYDLRFIAVHDRWPDGDSGGGGGAVAVRGDHDGGDARQRAFPNRTVNELKDRYYSVAKRVVERRAKAGAPSPSGPLQKHCQAILANPYDFEYENRRKEQIEVQYHRPNAELREEERIVREAQRIVAERRRREREQARFQKLLGAPGGDIRARYPARDAQFLGTSYDASAAMAAEGAGAADAEYYARQRGGGGGGGGIVGATGGGSSAHGAAEAEADVTAGGATAPSAGRSRRRKSLPAGPTARSSQMLAPISQSQRVQKRIDQVLHEMGVGIRPTPTAEICEEFDELRYEIANMLELQRLVKRKEDEARALRSKVVGGHADEGVEAEAEGRAGRRRDRKRRRARR